MKTNRERIIPGAAAIVAGVALIAGCGGSSPASSVNGTTSSQTASAASIAAAGAAAINKNAVFQGGLSIAYRFGATGCAIRMISASPAIYEMGAWYPGSANAGGAAWRFTVLDGVASPQGARIDHSAQWRPPGGANCVIHPSGAPSAP